MRADVRDDNFGEKGAGVPRGGGQMLCVCWRHGGDGVMYAAGARVVGDYLSQFSTELNQCSAPRAADLR